MIKPFGHCLRRRPPPPHPETNMLIDKTRLSAMLRRTASLWRDNSRYLGEIDSRFGDGDHGVTMEKIANLTAAGLDAWESDPQSMKSFIINLADGIMSLGGGSAGPLYGTFVAGLAAPLADDDKTIDGNRLKDMLAAALSSLRDITKAKPGDKTMMDAIVPACLAAANSGDDAQAILAAAAAAAHQGAEESKKHAAKFGRARNYGEQSIGAPDVGALSAALLFQGLSEGFAADLLA